MGEAKGSHEQSRRQRHVRGRWPWSDVAGKEHDMAVLISAVVLAVCAAASPPFLKVGKTQGGGGCAEAKIAMAMSGVRCKAGIDCSSERGREASKVAPGECVFCSESAQAALCVCVWAWLMRWGERPRARQGHWVP